jgi:hypothetical protein
MFGKFGIFNLPQPQKITKFFAKIIKFLASKNAIFGLLWIKNGKTKKLENSVFCRALLG